MRTVAKLDIFNREEIDYVFGADTSIDIETTGSTATLDVSRFSSFRVTINSDCAVVLNKGTTKFGWKTPAHTKYTITLAITQNDVGGKLVAWPQNVYWEGGIIPTLSTTAYTTDIFKLTTTDGGDSWFASLWGKGFRRAGTAGINLPAVANLQSSTADNATMDITWTASSDPNVTNYRVFSDGALVSTQSVSNTRYSFPLEVGGVRLITVRTYNNVFNLLGPSTNVVSYNPVPPAKPKAYYLNGAIGSANPMTLNESSSTNFRLQVDYSVDGSTVQYIQPSQPEYYPSSITATTMVDGQELPAGTVTFTPGTDVFTYTVDRMIKGYTSGTQFKTETPVKIKVVGSKLTAEFNFPVAAKSTYYYTTPGIMSDRYENLAILAFDIKDGEPDTDIVWQMKMTDVNNAVIRDDPTSGYAVKKYRLDLNGDLSQTPFKIPKPSKFFMTDGQLPTVQLPEPSATIEDNDWLYNYPLLVNMSLYSPKKYQWNNQPTKKLDVDSRTADWYKVGEITASINSPITWQDNYDGKSFKHGTGPLVFKIKGGPPNAKIVYTFKDVDASGYTFSQSAAGTYVDWSTLDANGNYDASLDSRFTSTGGPYTYSTFRETGTGRVLKWPHHFFIDVFVEWKGRKIKVSKDVDWFVTWPTVLNCSTQGITGYPSREDNYSTVEHVKFTISAGEPGAPISYSYQIYDRNGIRVASAPLARLKQDQVVGQPMVEIALDTNGNLNFDTLVPSAYQHTNAGMTIAQARTCNYPLKVENNIYMYTGSDAILLGPVVYYVAKPAQRVESSNSGVSWSDSVGGTTYGTVLFGPNNSSVSGNRYWKGSNTDYEFVGSGTRSTDAFGHFTLSESFDPNAFQWLTTRPNNPLTYPITQKYVINVGGVVYELYSTITA